MEYLFYILIGFLIILIVDLAVTSFWAIHDTLIKQKQDQISFKEGFIKYFVLHNNIPLKMSDLFD